MRIYLMFNSFWGVVYKFWQIIFETFFCKFVFNFECVDTCKVPTSLVVIVLLYIRLSVCYLIFIASIIYCLTNLKLILTGYQFHLYDSGFWKSAYMILLYFVYN